MTYITEEEIYSQPEVWSSVLERLSDHREEFQRRLNQRTESRFLFVGCGSSYYLGISAASVFTHVTGLPSTAYPASEINLFPTLSVPSGSRSVHPIFISRSGTTTEVLQAAKTIKKQTSDPLSGVSCRPTGEMRDLVSNCYLIPDADEASVVMTRSFTSMLLLLQGLAGIVTEDESFLDQLDELDETGRRMFDQDLDVAEEIITQFSCSQFVFLGQGPYYGLAREAALKAKEMSLSHASAYHSLEFRHGPRSLINEEMLITFLISETARDQEVKLMEEMHQTEARILAICEEKSPRVEENADYVLSIESGVGDFARLILYMPVVQLMGYHMALKNDQNPDNPSNLTQVVEL